MPDPNDVELVKGFLRQHTLDGRVAQVMVEQIATGLERDGSFPKMVVEGIFSIENPDQGIGFKRPEKFKRPVLSKYHKGHFWGSNLLVDMTSNIINFTSSPSFEGRIRALIKANGNDVLTKDMIEEITRLAVDGALDHRAEKKKLTGEWIVFRATRKGRFFLTLAAHDEPDEVIAARARLAEAQLGLG